MRLCSWQGDAGACGGLPGLDSRPPAPLLWAQVLRRSAPVMGSRLPVYPAPGEKVLTLEEVSFFEGCVYARASVCKLRVFSVGSSRAVGWRLFCSLGNRVRVISGSALYVGFQMLPWKQQKCCTGRQKARACSGGACQSGQPNLTAK